MRLPSAKTVHRVFKLFISGIVTSFDSLLALIHVGRARSDARIVVLYYHAIPDNQRSHFARQMDYLKRRTNPIRLDRIPHLQAGVYSAVTFDDAFQSVLRNALPELEKRKIPATLFVTTEALGKYVDWWPKEALHERQDPIVSVGELQQLSQDLISIGSHTRKHPRLTELSEMEARRELIESRTRLETLLNRAVHLFSFPFGAFSQALVEYCRDCGYERVFTSEPIPGSPNNFVVGRVAADPRDWPLEFDLKIRGAYRWLRFASRLKRRVFATFL